MTDPRTPIPDLRLMAEENRKIRERLDKLEMPTGTSSYGAVAKMQATIDYLLGLQSYAGVSNTFSSGTVPDDDAWHYFEPTPALVLSSIEIPTGRCVIEASLGEVSVTPGGSFVVGGVTFDLKDANGASIAGGDLGNDVGRLYTNQRLGVSVSTGMQFVSINPTTNPGPYSVRLYGAMWVSSLNTTPSSATFNDPALTLRVIENGEWL
jgi:hypothetical protein